MISPTPSAASSLATYRSQIGPRAPLTPDAERDLARRWREGDRRAGERLVGACLPFVVSIALEYRRWGLSLEDIVQEGNIGLLKAADRFDPERGCRLATYAAYWIRAEIREYVVRGYRIVRLGTSKNERRALRIYRKTHEADPAVLAEQSGLSEERARALLPLLVARDLSIDRNLAGGSPAVESLAIDAESPEEQACKSAERAHLSATLHRVLDELPARERTIVERRWLTEAPLTLEQLGVTFGVSKERVRQIEERALLKLRTRIAELTAEPTLALAS